MGSTREKRPADGSLGSRLRAVGRDELANGSEAQGAHRRGENTEGPGRAPPEPRLPGSQAGTLRPGFDPDDLPGH